MATGRKYHTQQVHYLRKALAYNTAATGVEVTVGTLPAGALVIGAGAYIVTVFNAASTNVIDIGTSGDPDGFATDLAAGTVGNIVWDELATSNDLYATTEVTVTANYAQTGTAATTGSAIIYVTYLANNDG